MRKGLSVFFQILLLAFFLTAFINIISVKYFNWVVIPVNVSTSEMFYDISVSYLVAYVVYFFTVLPTFISNIKKRNVIKKKLKNIHEFIKVRLGAMNCLLEDKTEFIQYLESKSYDQKVKFKEKEITCYELLNQINTRISKLNKLQILVISTNDSELYNTVDIILGHSFIRSNNIYIKYKLEDLTKKQMKIDIGASLYKLYHQDIQNAIVASRPFYKFHKK